MFGQVLLLASLNHPNVVKYHESFVEKDTLHIVMTYCSNGDLAKTIKTYARAKKFFEEEVCSN